MIVHIASQGASTVAVPATPAPAGEGKRGLTDDSGPAPKKGKKGTKPDGAETEDHSPAAKPGLEQVLVKEANKVKAQLMKHRSTAKTLIETIHSQPEWGWANNSQNVGELELKLGHLEREIVKSPFNSAFLINDAKAMKDRSGAAFQVNLESFNKLLEAVGAVQGCISCLMQKHKIELAMAAKASKA